MDEEENSDIFIDGDDIISICFKDIDYDNCVPTLPPIVYVCIDILQIITSVCMAVFTVFCLSFLKFGTTLVKLILCILLCFFYKKILP